MKISYRHHDGYNREVEDFLRANASIFHSFQFLSAIGDNYLSIAGYYQDKVVGVLPLVKTTKLGLKAYHLPPYTYKFGPVINVDLSAKYSYYDIASGLIKNLPKSSHYDFKLFLTEGDILPYGTAGFTSMALQTHLVPRNVEYSEQNIHKSKRRYLTKLLKKIEEGSIHVKRGKDCLQDLIWLQKETGAKSNFKTYSVQLEKIFATLETGEYYAIVIYDENYKPLSGAYCPYDKYFAYHLINASVNHPDSLLGKVNILSTYLAVKEALSLNLSFDFEGSNVPGVAHFYRMMGGEPRLIHRIQKSTSVYYQILRSFKQIKQERG